jgi:hypothetical protein
MKRLIEWLWDGLFACLIFLILIAKVFPLGLYWLWVWLFN